jgi:hypothetical protein
MSGKTNIFIMFYRGSIEVSWMIIHGCIRTHPKDCGGWIIVTVSRVLLISQYLFREILLMAVLGVHAGSVKI